MRYQQGHHLIVDEVMWQLLLLADPSSEAVKKYLQNGLLFVAFQEEQLCGLFVIVELTLGQWELKNIAVLPAYQRLGIGKQLLRQAEVEVGQRGGICLEIGTGNSSLDQLAFYQKQGFRIIVSNWIFSLKITQTLFMRMAFNAATKYGYRNNWKNIYESSLL